MAEQTSPDPSKNKAVIKTIAKEAGVSVATVSRVINNSPSVTFKTRQKVTTVMQARNYRPSIHAQGLNKRYASKLVGLISDSTRIFTNHYYFTEIIRGLETSALRTGYGLLLTTAEQLFSPELTYHLDLLDGIILLTAKIGDPIIKSMEGIKKPYVLLNCVSWKAGHVDINNLAGAQAAMEHLIDHGHHRIGFIGGQPEDAIAQERLIGYKSTLNKHGISLDESLIITTNFDEESGKIAAQRLLSLNSRPTAIFAANDYLAIGALAAARQIGLNLPGDLAIAGFDDIHASSHTTPTLTSVHQPLFEMGVQTMDLLTHHIKEKTVTSGRKFLLPGLRIRQSCGCK